MSRLRFGDGLEVQRLYFETGPSVVRREAVEGPCFELGRGDFLTTDSYFNSLYPNHWSERVDFGELRYELELEGDFEVVLCARDAASDGSEEILRKEVALPRIALPELASLGGRKRLYLRITCLSERGSFHGGCLVSTAPPAREVGLAVVMPTFRREACLKSTLARLLGDPALKELPLRVLVIDHDDGRVLTTADFPDSRVELVRSRNLGSSGGFTRGMLLAREHREITHLLLLDDDIELETESVFRAYWLLGYAKHGFVLCGSMLDLRRKEMLCEAGARFRPFPYRLEPIHGGLDLRSPSALDRLLEPTEPDYGGFWFMAFELAVLERIGALAPFFIRWDDVELCARIRGTCGLPLSAPPGIAVWHEPFYGKLSDWQLYYEQRNFLATVRAHRASWAASPLDLIHLGRDLVRRFVRELFSFNYNAASMLILALEHHLAGPEFLHRADPESVHLDVLKRSKAYPGGSPQTMPDGLPVAVSRGGRLTMLGKLLRMASLNGHLLPGFLLRGEAEPVRIGRGGEPRWNKSWSKEMILWEPQTRVALKLGIRHRAGIALTLRWSWLLARVLIGWRFGRGRWDRAAPGLGSIARWDQVFDRRSDKPMDEEAHRDREAARIRHLPDDALP